MQLPGKANMFWLKALCFIMCLCYLCPRVSYLVGYDSALQTKCVLRKETGVLYHKWFFVVVGFLFLVVFFFFPTKMSVLWSPCEKLSLHMFYTPDFLNHYECDFSCLFQRTSEPHWNAAFEPSSHTRELIREKHRQCQADTGSAPCLHESLHWLLPCWIKWK